MSIRRRVRIAAVVAFLGCIVLSGAVWQRRTVYVQAEARLTAGLLSLRSGDDVTRALALLGRPTHILEVIERPFAPADDACQRSSKTVMVYQPPVTRLLYVSRPTVMVFVSAGGRVTCVERTNVIRLRNVNHVQRVSLVCERVGKVYAGGA
jgi:hypothetical protein